LRVLPDELIERDYGCGDPSRYAARGETVLDLGCGGGKICYIASQIVGPEGRVMGVDMNDDMLTLAHKYQQQIGDRIGWHNVQFFKGRIQDLALDLSKFEAHLARQPVASADAWLAAQRMADELRTAEPMIPSDSVNLVLSNCVLNLVDPRDRRQMFQDIFRVLRRGGRAVISDITCDEVVPQRLRDDPELWSGCISGAFLESEFLQEFEQAGFYGVEIVSRQQEPWCVLEGIEFRSMTVRAYKGKEGPCMDHKQAVIYQGPWKSVVDDDGHTLRRGVRTAVCEKTFEIYTRSPYAGQIQPIPPSEPIDPATAPLLDCRQNAIRTAAETKGPHASQASQLPVSNCCTPEDC
jgi:SAM-dependent methyltransferase